ncbi:MAG TPA: terpene synthase family protein [Vicinamibacterales bacterium]|nr:terpene synthase family protein [Vicinamibacterales bacterium]
MHRPRPALSPLAAPPLPRVEERERRVALAFIDAACLLGVDGRGAPTEVHFAEDMAVWLLAIDWATASALVRERLEHLMTAGKDAVRASIAERLPTTAEREAAYLVASAAIYRDDHFAHRQARALVDLAGILQLDRASVDRLSTNDPRPLGALYPRHWRLAPASPAGTINDSLEAWARSEGLLKDPRGAAALRALDLETFQRLTFPRCGDVSALLWAAKYTLFLYLFDDIVERYTATGDLAAARAFVTPCLAVPANPRAPTDAHSMIGTFAALTRELYERSRDPDLPAKWEGAHRRYWMLGILSEVATSEGGNEAVGLAHHLRTRPWASGVEIYFDIGEVICDALMPPQLYAASEVRDIRYVGALIGGVFNDLISFEKEKPYDNLANIALALRREFQLDDRGALTYAIALHDELVRDCDQRIDRFRARGGAAFVRYADMLRQVLHGLAAWQLQSRRYVNRHTVVLSDGRHRNPDIDADRIEMLRRLAAPQRDA